MPGGRDVITDRSPGQGDPSGGSPRDDGAAHGADARGSTGGRVARLLVTPRWIARTILAIVAIALCVAASLWQYTRTQDQLAVARAAVADVAPVEEVVPGGTNSMPTEALGRRVTVVGTVVPAARSYVRSRVSAEGRSGYLVVDGVRLADGRVLPVLQGWVEDPAQGERVSAGRSSRRPTAVRLEGRLQPEENFYATAAITQGPLVTITHAGLASQWGVAAGDLVPGYLTVTSPSPSSAYERSAPVVGTDPDVPFPLQNVFYSVQWLVFAGFVIFMWIRWFRLDLREDERDAIGAPGGSG